MAIIRQERCLDHPIRVAGTKHEGMLLCPMGNNPFSKSGTGTLFDELRKILDPRQNKRPTVRWEAKLRIAATARRVGYGTWHNDDRPVQ